MGVLPFYVKRSAESFAIGLDFSDEMPESTTLVSGVCSAESVSTGTDATGALLTSGTTAVVNSTTSTANIVVAGGVPGNQYNLIFLMTLSNGHTIEGLARLMVDD